MMKMKVVLSLALILFIGMSAQAVVTSVGSDADTYLRDETVRGGYDFMDIRGSYYFTGYLRFDLSALGAATIQDASLTLTVSGNASRNDTLTTGRFALYGLDNIAGNTPQNWDESTFVLSSAGAEWTGSIPPDLMRVTDLDMETVAGITETLVPSGGSADAGTTVTVTGAPLVAFIQSRVDDGGLLNFMIGLPSSSDRGYGLATKEHATEEWRPVLNLTYIPEPASLALLGLGSLLILRRRNH